MRREDLPESELAITPVLNADDLALQHIAKIILHPSPPTQAPAADSDFRSRTASTMITVQNEGDEKEEPADDVINPDKQPLLSESAVNSIQDSSQQDSNYWISGLTGFLLTGRGLACGYRYLMISAYMDIVFKLPLLNHTNEYHKQCSGIAVASFFLLVDVLVSIIKPEKNVRAFFTDLVKIIRNRCASEEDCPRETHPWDLRILGAIAIFSSGYRGYVGFIAVAYNLATISEFNFLSSHVAKIARTAMAIYAALASSTCFYSYQYQEKSVGSWRVMNELKTSENQLQWKQVQQQRFYKEEYKLGMAVAIAAGVNAAMAPLFHDGTFALDTWKLILFLSAGIPNVFFNLHYAYFRVFMLRCVVKEAERKELIEKEKQKAPMTVFEKIAESRLFYVITDINSIGNGLTFSVAIIQTFIIIFSLIAKVCNSTQLHDLSENSYSYLGLTLLSIPFVYGAWKQSRGMWQSNSHSAWFSCCDKQAENTSSISHTDSCHMLAGS